MRCDFSMGNTRMKLVAGAVLMCLASAASAATTLVGGGATLPAIGYTGTAAAANTPIIPGAGSLLGVYSSATGGAGNPTSYCTTGSGAGKKILAENDNTHFDVNGTCASTTVPVPQPVGFGGVGLARPHFAASDAPISSSEFNAYVAGHGAGTQPVQLPAIAGAISIVFHKTGVNTLSLNETQICGIFSGQIKTWNSPALAGAGIPTGTTGDIKVVFRSDGSGTSFAFLNHLSAVCPSNVDATNGVNATQFKTNQVYSGLDALGNPTGASAYVGSYAAGSTGANGNKGITDTVNLLDGSIGYAEAANGVTAPARFASVKNSHGGTAVNPSTGFGPTALAVNLVYNNAISDSVTSTGRPILAPLSGVTGQCLAVVNPQDYADPTSGYPILAVTYLLANAQGNGADAAGVRGLLFSPYNQATRSMVTKIGRITTGYSWLSNATLDGKDANGNQTFPAQIAACVN